MKKLKLYLLSFTFFLSAHAAQAADPALGKMSVDQRLQRMENMMSSDMLIEQTQGLDMLREEISSLRSMLEQQEFALETIKQRQRSLYMDMDRRLMHLESGAVNVSRSPVRPPSAGGPVTPVPIPGIASPAAESGAKQAYSSAFELPKEGRYAQSIEAFSQFLKQYPNSQYTDNAQYWLGEANYVSREYKVALDEFNKLIASHPDSSKIPGARLKIGYVYYELKNWTEARNMLALVVKSYPNTTVAKKASERLDRMKREGH